MKRYGILAAGIAVILGLVWISLGHAEEAKSERSGPRTGERQARGAGEGRGRGMWLERQKEAISAIEGQLTKIKSMSESFSGNRQQWQQLSEEERSKLREKFRKVHEERQQSIAIIEEQTARLKGRRRLSREHEEFIGKLNVIGELAKKEKSTETAAGIEKLISEEKKGFEERMKKLGMEPRPKPRTRTQTTGS